MKNETENTGTRVPVRRSKWKKFRNLSLAVLLLAGVAFFAIRFYYPFGEGVKSGQLNFVVYKGVLFKTYEGRLIQTGFKTNTGGGLQSNEFNFSVTDKEIAEKLMNAGGQVVDLHYKEYFGALPWRGYSKYVVDRIITMSPVREDQLENYPPVNVPQ